ncbi:hypothetical protein DVA43_02510 [Leclercia sp. W6]|uniref:hypothetical protein n=1 Tax=Leclercia sp. W6 TaxID=2282310 RepID=UPI000DF36EC7|nr:hypothetical protein [Leclercia sp. W6]AXF58507.1 hypothetical protein DVA43_02510 [Leclercia sp. W6]
MPRAPKQPPRVMGNGHDKGFQPGRKKTGGRRPSADVWEMLETAAQLANDRADREDKVELTKELLVAQLIETVRRTAPDTALRVLVPTLYSKATVKPVNIKIDTTTEGLPASLEAIAQQMANGGDITALTAVFTTLKELQTARAAALELRALERELEK